MASNYTTNYGLCQWEAGDQFVRSEFNQDNAKIDAALAQGREALALLGRNTYNLLLREARAGRSVGWQQGLVMEAFLERPQGPQLTTGLFWEKAHQRLCIDGTAQSTALINYGTNFGRPLAVDESVFVPWTATGSGLITKISLYVTGNGPFRLQIVRVDGTQTTSTTLTATGAKTVTFTDLFLPRGDYQIRVTNTGTEEITVYSYADVSSEPFGVRIDMDSSVISEGTYTTLSTDPGVSWRFLRGWVRYQGGSLTPSIELDDAWTSLSHQGRAGVLEDGASCTEGAFSLDLSTLQSGAFRLKFDVRRTADEFHLCDCGVVLL